MVLIANKKWELCMFFVGFFIGFMITRLTYFIIQNPNCAQRSEKHEENVTYQDIDNEIRKKETDLFTQLQYIKHLKQDEPLFNDVDDEDNGYFISVMDKQSQRSNFPNGTNTPNYISWAININGSMHSESNTLRDKHMMKISKSPEYIEARDFQRYYNISNSTLNCKDIAKQYTIYGRWISNYGFQYILDDHFCIENTTKQSRSYIQISFGPLILREVLEKYSLSISKNDLMENKTFDVGNLTEEKPRNDRIYFILPLSGLWMKFKRFLYDFEREVLEMTSNNGQEKHVILVLSIFGTDIKNSTFMDSVNKAFVHLFQKHQNFNAVLVTGDTTMSRARALDNGVKICGENDLLFFIDVDMTFKRALLDSIRLHTIQGKKVYFPIVFSEYNPMLTRNVTEGSEYDHFQFDNDFGHWRTYGLGMLAIYKSDYKSVGGFDRSFVEWGDEDVDLHRKIKKYGKLEIFRAPEPSLVHVYHTKKCSRKLKKQRLRHCRSSAMSNFSSKRFSFVYLLQNPKILEKRNLRFLKKNIRYRHRKRGKH